MQIRTLITLNTVDSSPVGRFDPECLSDQSLIELLVSRFDDPCGFQEANGDLKEIGLMSGIETDGNGNIESINLGSMLFEGTLDMRFMPKVARLINFENNTFEGIFDCGLIPVNTRFVNLGMNNLTGSVELGKLSVWIKLLRVSLNHLSGTINFQDMPENMFYLDLSGNNLNGSIDIRHIRADIRVATDSNAVSFYSGDKPETNSRYLNLSRNKFAGDILIHNIARISSLTIFNFLHCPRLADEYGTFEDVKQRN